MTDQNLTIAQVAQLLATAAQALAALADAPAHEATPAQAHAGHSAQVLAQMREETLTKHKLSRPTLTREAQVTLAKLAPKSAQPATRTHLPAANKTRKCEAKTKAGTACKNLAYADGTTCRVHSHVTAKPSKARTLKGTAQAKSGGAPKPNVKPATQASAKKSTPAPTKPKAKAAEKRTEANASHTLPARKNAKGTYDKPRFVSPAQFDAATGKVSHTRYAAAALEVARTYEDQLRWNVSLGKKDEPRLEASGLTHEEFAVVVNNHAGQWMRISAAEHGLWADDPNADGTKVDWRHLVD